MIVSKSLLRSDKSPIFNDATPRLLTANDSLQTEKGIVTVICLKMLYKVSSKEWIDVKKFSKLVSICLILAAKVIFYVIN